MRRLLAAFAAAVAVAAPATASEDPTAVTITDAPASRRNYPHTRRPASAIRLIVVHAGEGSYGGVIAWFRNPRARVSAHYVVSRDGDIAQTVPDRYPAWHAGNARVNRTSIGIEHEGYTWVEGTFTDAQYRASARLVARLARRYVLRIDRRHIIGHNEVPDPYRRGRFGGYAHHSDPGPSWDWARYLAYVRSYARGVEPPAPPLDVTMPGISIGQALRDVIRWEALPIGAPVERVEFLVDRRVRETVRQPPFVFAGGAWETWREPNGRRVLTARAVTPDGRRVVASVVVRVANLPPVVRIIGVSLSEGQSVTGVVHVEAAVEGPAQRVEFLVDGAVRATLAAPPYAFDWNAAAEAPGAHRLTVRAVAPNGRPTTRNVNVVVTP